MKRKALAYVWGGYVLALSACSEAECADGQRKIGSVCVNQTKTDASAATASDGSDDLASDGSTITKPVPDASVDSATATQAPSAATPDSSSTAAAPDAAAESDAAGPAPAVPVSPTMTPSPTPDPVPTPVPTPTPAVPSCVPYAESCDGKDNNCNGQIDEDAQGAATWFKDCDGDGFATSKTGSLVSCKVPPLSGSCKAWTEREPLNASDTDCDDSDARYRPGADFGLPSGTNPSNDLNCDGKTDTKATLTPATGADLTLCAYTVTCECWRVYSRNGQFVQEWLDWNEKGTASADPHPQVPCSTGETDLIDALRWTNGPEKFSPETPGCRGAFVNNAFVMVPAHQLCR